VDIPAQTQSQHQRLSWGIVYILPGGCCHHSTRYIVGASGYHHSQTTRDQTSQREELEIGTKSCPLLLRSILPRSHAHYFCSCFAY
jgi:hypothetical protein